MWYTAPMMFDATTDRPETPAPAPRSRNGARQASPSRGGVKTRKQGSLTGMAEEERRIVLVGTYKGSQLTGWRGWYNYPVSDDDKITEADAAKITELWLFQGTKAQRNYKAEFVGVKTREELIRDYGYPAKGKAHGKRYLLFKTEFKYRHKLDNPLDCECVFVRTADFAKRSPEVAKQLRAYLESPDRDDPDLADKLPSVILQLPPDKLRVCESAVQLEFLFRGLPILHDFNFKPMPRNHPASKVNSRAIAISLFSGAGGLSEGLSEAEADRPGFLRLFGRIGDACL